MCTIYAQYNTAPESSQDVFQTLNLKSRHTTQTQTVYDKHFQTMPHYEATVPQIAPRRPRPRSKRNKQNALNAERYKYYERCECYERYIR